MTVDNQDAMPAVRREAIARLQAIVGADEPGAIYPDQAAALLAALAALPSPDPADDHEQACNAGIVTKLREATRRITGGNGAFADDDLSVLIMLAQKAWSDPASSVAAMREAAAQVAEVRSNRRSTNGHQTSRCIAAAIRALPVQPEPVGDEPACLKRFDAPFEGMLSPIILVHQLRASANIQDTQTRAETGWATTSDRAGRMRTAADAIETLVALPRATPSAAGMDAHSPADGEGALREVCRQHVMPGDPPELGGIALRWYTTFDFAHPHTTRESNVAVESFKDGFRAALSATPDTVPQDGVAS